MKKAIVTTTINPVTPALKKFLKIAKRDNWKLIIVGDKKTPHQEYKDLEDQNPGTVWYLDPDHQEAISKELSDLIGWNCIQRRNFGLIFAYQQGAEVIATVDDDNIPLPNWGKNLVVGQMHIAKIWHTDQVVMDPLAATVQGPNIWHRGFPVQLLKNKNKITPVEKVEARRIMVQADLWNGDPDIDAICRIAKGPTVKFDSVTETFGSDKPMPFNSQNTFIHREAMAWYFLWPHIGRMDDIWAAYFLQRYRPDSVVFAPPSVVQERNEHDLVKDLDAELIGYHHTPDFIDWCYNPERQGSDFPEYLPKESAQAYEVYRKLIKAD